MASYKGICVASLLILLAQECHLQLNVCGQPPLNTKIIGGQVAAPGSWPWQVSLQISGSHFCGGSLINSQWVMTAAHCFQSYPVSSVTAVLGLQTQSGSNPNSKYIALTKAIVHPSYNTKSNDNDICLLQLASSVTFTDFIQPICLAASGSSFYNGTEAWVTGWGTTANGATVISQSLREVEVPIVGNRQCNCDYGVGVITNNMMCAGLSAGGKDSCEGDSGGPLVSKQGGRWIQGGIVSFGKGCAEPNFPGIYSRVSQYQSWINSQITSNQPGFITFMSDGTDGDLSITCFGLPPPTTTVTTTVNTSTNSTTCTTTSTTATSISSTSTTTTTTPQPVVCGQARLNSGNLGGNATAGTWPWMVSLQRNGSHVCGGTLVAMDAVLSSADCFSSSSRPSDWTVVLGDLQLNGSNPFGVTLNVINITVSNLTGANVAVLHLTAQPPMSDYIQPICLDAGQTFAVGSTCWAAGWSSGQGGETEVLQQLQTTVANCGNISASNSFCTGFIALAQADSGGPIMCQQNGAWFQAAVLTLTTNGSTAQTRAGEAVMTFSKLSNYNSFLTRILGLFLSPASSATTAATTAATTTPTTTISMVAKGGTAAQLPLLCLHLLVFITCLHFL